MRRSGGGSKASLDMGSPSQPSKSKSIQNLSSISERAPSASEIKIAGRSPQPVRSVVTSTMDSSRRQARSQSILFYAINSLRPRQRL